MHWESWHYKYEINRIIKDTGPKQLERETNSYKTASCSIFFSLFYIHAWFGRHNTVKITLMQDLGVI